MLKELQLWWKEKRLSRLYIPLIDGASNSKNREDIWREYSDELNELNTQRKLHEEASDSGRTCMTQEQ